MTCKRTLCSAPPDGVVLPATVFYAPLVCGRLHVLYTHFTSASGVQAPQLPSHVGMGHAAELILNALKLAVAHAAIDPGGVSSARTQTARSAATQALAIASLLAGQMSQVVHPNMTKMLQYLCQ